MTLISVASGIGMLILLFLCALFLVQIIKVFIPSKSYVPAILFGLFSVLTALGAGKLSVILLAGVATITGGLPAAIAWGFGCVVYLYIATGFAEKLVDSSAS